MSTPSRPTTPTPGPKRSPSSGSMMSTVTAAGSQSQSSPTGSTRSRLKSLRNVHLPNLFSRSPRNSIVFDDSDAHAHSPPPPPPPPPTTTPPPASSMSSPAGTPSKKLRRSLRERFTGHGRGTGRAQIEPLADERPAAVLRVQVVGCDGLRAADKNGKSDPYVVVTFARQRHKTPVISRSLNPRYGKDATFDFPVYASVVEKIGSLVELVVWDKDTLGKDYLGEVGLTASDWFKHNGGPAALDFAAPDNTTFSLPLVSSRKREAKGTITLKLGFVSPPTLAPGAPSMGDAYADLTRRARGGQGALLSAPPTQGIGTLASSGDGAATVDAGAESDDDDVVTDRSSLRSSTASTTASSVSTPPKKLPSFRLNWSGTKIDYSFSGHRDVAGIVLLEIRMAKNLPTHKTSMLKTSAWDMDPFVVVTFGNKTFRTRVVRHSLEPVWNEKIMFHVRKADLEKSSKIQISVLDWDKFSSDDLVGDAAIHVGELMARAPPPDKTTGLYTEDMNLANGLAEMELPLTVSKELADGKTASNAVVVVSAKYEPHASFRQRFWRQNLHTFDADGSRSFAFSEIRAFLDDMGLALDADTVYGFFAAHGKRALDEQLSLDETVQSLEEAIGTALEKGQRPPWAEHAARAVDREAEKDRLETESLSESVEAALKDLRGGAITEEHEAEIGNDTLEPDSIPEHVETAQEHEVEAETETETEAETEDDSASISAGAMTDSFVTAADLSASAITTATTVEDEDEEKEAEPKPLSDGAPTDSPTTAAEAAETVAEDEHKDQDDATLEPQPTTETETETPPELTAAEPEIPVHADAPSPPTSPEPALEPVLTPEPELMIEEDDEPTREAPMPAPQPRASTYGRNRESIVDLDAQLHDIFASHPDADVFDPEKPSVPARALVDVLREFSDAHGGLELLDPEDEEQLKSILDASPDVPISADVLLAFVAQYTGQQQSPPPPPLEEEEDVHSDEAASPSAQDAYFAQDDEGDVTTRAPPSAFGAHSRSSSRSSVHTTRGEESPEPMNGEPKTPRVPTAFDARQRSTPMQAAPTSWKPQSTFRRRRSSAGSQGRPAHISDNESSSNERRTSNPTSPAAAGQTFPTGRRAASRPVSPHRQNSNGHVPQRGRYGSQGMGIGMGVGMGDSGVLVPRPGERELDEHDAADEDEDRDGAAAGDGSDSEPEDTNEHDLVRPRDSVAFPPFEKLEELTRSNTELARKLAEMERALASKSQEHEMELEELQVRLDEVTEELLQAKREEKELRGRERSATTALVSLESEVSKLQRQLETSRASYQSLQKQYQEQCAESEKYRNSLRRKDQDLKEAEENAQAHYAEMTKWKTAQESSEASIASLEHELQISRQAQQTLYEQKQENLMLKETIDRLRFDLDELRTTKTTSVGGASGSASAAGTLSRSLATELKAQLEDDVHDANKSREEVVEEVEETERGSDDDYVETIIKRRKKVIRRATPGAGPSTETVVKEYTDEATQHGPADYSVSGGAQTDAPPLQASTSAQTDELAEPELRPKTPPPKPEAPPPYHVIDEAERESISKATIEKWHPGYAARGVQGVTRDAVREWANLKRELGFECAAIDKVVTDAPVVGDREPARETLEIEEPREEEESVRGLSARLVHRVVDVCHRRLGLSPAVWTGFLAVICAFSGVLFISLLFSSAFNPVWPNYVVPSYHDRVWWSTYNSLGASGLEGMHRRSSGFWQSLWNLWSIIPLGGVDRPRLVPT